MLFNIKSELFREQFVQNLRNPVCQPSQTLKLSLKIEKASTR